MNQNADDFQRISDLLTTYAETLKAINEAENLDRFTSARICVSVCYILDAAETVAAIANDFYLKRDSK